MSSDKLLSRVAMATLCAAFAAAASHAGAQTQPKPRAPRSLFSRPALPGPTAAPEQPELATPPDNAPMRDGEADAALSGAANYGAPRRAERLPRPYPPRPGLRPAPFTPRNGLPALEPYRTAPQPRQQPIGRLRGTTQPLTSTYPPPPTIAAQPLLRVKPKPRVEEKPFDPVGIGIGSLRLSPFVEVSGGYDDNPNRFSKIVVGKRGSSVLRGDAGFALKSDWDRHSVIADLRLGYAEYFDYTPASRPDGAGSFTGRYDVTRDTSLDLKGRMALDTIRPGAPAISNGLAVQNALNRPITLGLGVAPGVTHRFNRLEVSLRGTFDRAFFENIRYNDGTQLDLSRTNYNAYGGAARVSYEITPDLKPFVEGGYDWRIHDSQTDFNGFYRDSEGFNVRGGAQINFSDLLKGEASGGYAERAYKDARLPRLRGPTVDAALIYTPSALTTVTLRGTTSLNETTLANAAGALTRNISLQLSHDLLRNLNVTALGSYFENEYQGADVRERGFSAGVKLDYKVTRSISLRGSYIHEQLNTSFPNADYTANVYLVGLRFQL